MKIKDWFCFLNLAPLNIFNHVPQCNRLVFDFESQKNSLLKLQAMAFLLLTRGANNGLQIFMGSYFRTKWIRIKRGPGVRSIQAIICYQSWGSNFYHWVWLCQCVMYFGHQWKEFWSVRWEWMIWYQMHSRDQWGRDPSNARMWKNIGIIGKFLKNW